MYAASVKERAAKEKEARRRVREKADGLDATRLPGTRAS
jgi:hypothetical protein